MPTFIFSKLVRDKIGQMHIDAGHKLTIKNLSGQDLVKALCEKLHEEADEVSSALSRDELIEEIADVQQVLNDLCKLQNINKDTLEDVRMKKESLKGGFTKGVYIDQVHMPVDDEWVAYYRRAPSKYPELTDL